MSLTSSRVQRPSCQRVRAARVAATCRQRGVGYQRLAAVHGPAVRRGLQARKGLELGGGEELEVAPVGVGKLAGAAGEQLGKPLGSFGDRGHGQACYARCLLTGAGPPAARTAPWLRCQRELRKRGGPAGGQWSARSGRGGVGRGGVGRGGVGRRVSSPRCHRRSE